MNPFMHPEVVESINNVVRPWIEEWKPLGHRRMILEGNLDLFQRLHDRFPEDLIEGMEVVVYHGSSKSYLRTVDSCGHLRLTVSNANHKAHLRYPING